MERKNLKLSLVIPVFNEDENLDKLYANLKNVLVGELADSEIIIVDDGSQDASVELIKRIIESDDRVQLIALSRNWGHQKALTAGLDCANGDFIITIDADLQHPPELICRMVKTATENNIDVLHMIKKSQNRGILTVALSKIFYFIFKKASCTNIETISSDFRLYSKKAVNELRKITESDRFLRGLSVWIGLKQCFLYYDVQDRFAGRPKYTHKKLLNLAASGIFSFSALPIRVSIYLGLLIIVFNVLYVCFIIYSYLFHNIGLKGYTTTIVSILFLFSFLFIFLGIIGEYIFRIYQEVKNRPLYVVKEHIGKK